MSDRNAVLSAVADELASACAKFGPMASPHEGWAVIREELDELWEHVKANAGRSDGAQAEAVQVAAMALRYAHDLCGNQPALRSPRPRAIKCFNHDEPDCPICLRWAAEASS